MLHITTSRLTLRPLQYGDEDAVFAYRSDPVTTQYQTWRPDSLRDIRDIIKQQKNSIPGMPGAWYQLAILLRSTNELIGDCGFFVSLENHTNSELGITLKPEKQRQGYASEVLHGLIVYCFSTLGMQQITARIFVRNQSAITLVERNGFEFYARSESRLTNRHDEGDLIYFLTKDSYNSYLSTAHEKT